MSKTITIKSDIFGSHSANPTTTNNIPFTNLLMNYNQNNENVYNQSYSDISNINKNPNTSIKSNSFPGFGKQGILLL